MKMFARWSLVVVFGVLLTVVSGCQEEKVAPVAVEDVENAATAAEEPAAEKPAADVPMDHPAH